MRIVVSRQVRTDHEEIRRIVRRGFKGVKDSARVEIHVKAAWRTEWVDVFGDQTRLQRSRKVQAEGFSGYAYNGVPGIASVAKSTRWLVTLKMPSSPLGTYPRTQKDCRAKSMPEYEVRSWQEDLLAVAAHESFHVRQYQNKWVQSEVEAERHAAWTLVVARKAP